VCHFVEKDLALAVFDPAFFWFRDLWSVLVLELKLLMVLDLVIVHLL